MLIKLIDAAMERKWDYVDASLDNINEEKQFVPLVRWAAVYGLGYKNADVRDLAGTILERAPIPEQAFGYVRDAIAEAMNRETENLSAKDRFAFALAAHGPGKYRPEVMLVLKKALGDKKVSAIAEKYLSGIK